MASPKIKTKTKTVTILAILTVVGFAVAALSITMYLLKENRIVIRELVPQIVQDEKPQKMAQEVMPSTVTTTIRPTVTPNTTVPTVPVTCNTPECITLAYQLHNWKDSKTDPCDDFYQYSCGRFVEFSNEQSPTQDKYYSLTRLVKTLLVSKTPTTSNSEIIMRKLYEKCVDKGQGSMDPGTISVASPYFSEPAEDFVFVNPGAPMGPGTARPSSKTRAQDFYDQVILVAFTSTSFDLQTALNMMAKMGVMEFGLFGIRIIEVGDKKIWEIQPPGPASKIFFNDFSNYFIWFLRNANITLTDDEVRTRIQNAESLQRSLSNSQVDGTFNASNLIDVEELSLAVPEINFKQMFRQILDDPRIDNHIKTYRYDLFFKNQLSNALNNTTENTQTVIDLLTFAIFTKMVAVIRDDVDCAKVIVDRMPRASLRFFTRNYFKKENRETMSELIEDVRNSYIDIFKKNTWMDESTRKAAIEKAEKMGKIIGYGEEYEPEGALDAMYDEYMSSGVLNQSYFSAMRKLAETHALHLAEYVLSKNSFNIAGHIFETNAHYSRSNKFTVLIPYFDDPFFDASWPKYAQIGGVGRVVAHEIGHAFDSKGRYFDKDGILNDWWSVNDKKVYDEKAQCVVDQYSNYEDPDFGKMDGDKRLGENIADLIGMKAVWNAHKNMDASKQPKLFGFEDYPVDKLFWQIGALLRCEHRYDPGRMKGYVMEQVHAVKKFRVNGVYQNMPGFAETFNCPVGSPMNPAKKCELF